MYKVKWIAKDWKEIFVENINKEKLSSKEMKNHFENLFKTRKEFSCFVFVKNSDKTRTFLYKDFDWKTCSVTQLILNF